MKQLYGSVVLVLVLLLFLSGCATFTEQSHKYVDLGAQVAHQAVETGSALYQDAKTFYEWVVCLVTACPPPMG